MLIDIETSYRVLPIRSEVGDRVERISKVSKQKAERSYPLDANGLLTFTFQSKARG